MARVIVKPRQVAVQIKEVRPGRVIVTRPAPIEVRAVGPQGPPGPPGADGGVRTDLAPAAPIGGHRLVTLDESGLVIPADCRIEAHVLALAGMTTSAGIPGAPVPIRFAGPVTDPALAVIAGPVWLGYDGAWVQSVPESGAVLIVGHGEPPHTIFLRSFSPILRGE